MTSVEFWAHLCIPVRFLTEEHVGPFTCFSGHSHSMSRRRKPRCCLQKIKSVGLTEWSFPLTSALKGPGGSVSVSSVSQLWSVTLSFDFMGSPGLKPQDWAEGRTVSENSSEEFSLDVRGLLILWLRQCFWLQIVNHELGIDLSPSPSYLLIFNCCALLSLSLREVSMEKESAWFNWKGTGLMLDRPAWLRHLPGAWPQGQFALWASVLENGANNPCSSRWFLLGG